MPENDAPGGQFEELPRETCTRLMEVCRGAIYICVPSAELHTLYQAFTAAGGHWVSCFMRANSRDLKTS